MSKFIKENWKILLIFLILVILFPIIILVPSSIGFIPQDIGLQIISYGGSIFGGFLTLYGVWWTIKNQNIRYFETQQIEYSPSFYFNKTIKTELYTYNPYSSKTKEYRGKAILEIKNFGFGKAIDIIFNQEKFTEKNFNEYVSLKQYFLPILEENKTYNLEILFDISWKNPFKETKQLILEVECKNILSHIFIYKVYLNVKILENEYARKNKNKYLLLVEIQKIEKK